MECTLRLRGYVIGITKYDIIYNLVILILNSNIPDQIKLPSDSEVILL